MVDPCSAKFILTVTGALSEVVGLGLVVWQTWDTRDAARDLLPAGQTRYVSAVSSGESALAVAPTGGSQPPIDERVATLERDHANLRDELGETKRRLRQQVAFEVGRAHTQALEHADERDRALRGFLSDQLQSGVGRSLAGVAFFVCGVIMSAVANVL